MRKAEEALKGCGFSAVFQGLLCREKEDVEVVEVVEEEWSSCGGGGGGGGRSVDDLVARQMTSDGRALEWN